MPPEYRASRLAARDNHLRVRQGHEHNRVTSIELFFDLVFVFAVTQLSHGLLAHLTPLGAIQIFVVAMAVWWAWIDTAWITNWLDPDRMPVRMLLFALMLCGLVMAASIPKAFEDRGAAFAGAYVLGQVGRSTFMLWAVRNHDRANYINFLRIVSWQAAAGVFWIAGAFAGSETRLILWALGAAIETSAPILGFFVPGLGRSLTADWAVEGAHMAERCSLFVIIALGESILVTGATFAGLAWTAENIGAFLVAFAGSVAMWVIYFNIGAERGSRRIEDSSDPGRLARNAYTYVHIIIVIGIVVIAVGDELVLHHASGHIDLKTAIVLIAGPAIYLAGNSLFKRLSAPNFPLSHAGGLVLLTLLIPAIHWLSPLLFSAATTALLMIVATWEWLSLRRSSHVATPAHH